MTNRNMGIKPWFIQDRKDLMRLKCLKRRDAYGTHRSRGATHPLVPQGMVHPRS